MQNGSAKFENARLQQEILVYTTHTVSKDGRTSYWLEHRKASQ